MWNLKQEQQPKNPSSDTENRLVVARVVGCGCGLDKMGEGGQQVQTSSYKIKLWGCNVQHSDCR